MTGVYCFLIGIGKRTSTEKNNPLSGHRNYVTVLHYMHTSCSRKLSFSTQHIYKCCLCISVAVTMFCTDCGFRGLKRRLCLPARRRELGCRLLFWRCPSHFAESPWKREGRHYSSSSSAKAPGDFLRSETCPPQPGSSDPSRDALVTAM